MQTKQSHKGEAGAGVLRYVLSHFYGLSECFKFKQKMKVFILCKK